MRFKTSKAALVAVTLLAGLQAGCATHPEVRQQQDQRVDLRSYKTFAFFEPEPGSRVPYSSIVGAQLRDSTRRALEKEHYVYSEVNPDLRVNVAALVVERQELRSTPTRAGFIGVSQEIHDYRQGTVLIDLVDAERHALVWRGVAQGRLNEQAMKEPLKAVDAAVNEIFAHYPNGAVN